MHLNLCLIEDAHTDTHTHTESNSGRHNNCSNSCAIVRGEVEISRVGRTFSIFLMPSRAAQLIMCIFKRFAG